MIRVFPRRTSYTPTGDDVFIGDPPMIRPDASEVHVSVTFTWDVEKALRLKESWGQYYPVVKIGGPAISGSNGSFIPGRYIKHGVTFASRGCNDNCPWCLVRQREGVIQELPIHPGNILQDNNILQCNKSHIHKVFDMLNTQRQVYLSGGLAARLLTTEYVDRIRSLKLAGLFVACDADNRIKELHQAAKLLKDIPRAKKRCYVLIGYNNETIEKALIRLQAVWDAGFLPFCQLYQPPDKYIQWDYSWRTLQRNWSRPAITKKLAK